MVEITASVMVIPIATPDMKQKTLYGVGEVRSTLRKISSCIGFLP